MPPHHSSAPDPDPYGGQHPKDRAIEDEDPMLLTAEPVDGDPELMFTSIVEEFARQGFDADHIMQLFASPFFQATWGLRQLYGEDGVRTRVDATLARCGVHRFRTQHAKPGTVACEDEPPDILNCAPPPQTTQLNTDVDATGTGENDAIGS
jgi:hypothetical protein